MIGYWIWRLTEGIAWIYYPKTHSDECTFEAIGRIVVIGWFVPLMTSAVLGFGKITALLFILPVALGTIALKYGPAALSGLKLAEDSGIVSDLPEWVSIARLVSLPIGVLQDLIAISLLTGPGSKPKRWSGRR